MVNDLNLVTSFFPSHASGSNQQHPGTCKYSRERLLLQQAVPLLQLLEIKTIDMRRICTHHRDTVNCKQSHFQELIRFRILDEFLSQLMQHILHRRIIIRIYLIIKMSHSIKYVL